MTSETPGEMEEEEEEEMEERRPANWSPEHKINDFSSKEEDDDELHRTSLQPVQV